MAIVTDAKVLKKIVQEALKRIDMPGGTPKASVVIGYTASYALLVHENLEAFHAPGKSAQFLIGPFRAVTKSGELARIMDVGHTKGVPFQQALFLAGLWIQRDSQQVVPVDKGNLRGSAFTRKE